METNQMNSSQQIREKYMEHQAKWVGKILYSAQELDRSVGDELSEYVKQHLMQMRWAITHLEALVYCLDGVEMLGAEGYDVYPDDAFAMQFQGLCKESREPIGGSRVKLPSELGIPERLQCAGEAHEFPWDEVEMVVGRELAKTQRDGLVEDDETPPEHLGFLAFGQMEALRLEGTASDEPSAHEGLAAGLGESSQMGAAEETSVFSSGEKGEATLHSYASEKRMVVSLRGDVEVYFWATEVKERQQAGELVFFLYGKETACFKNWMAYGLAEVICK